MLRRKMGGDESYIIVGEDSVWRYIYLKKKDVPPLMHVGRRSQRARVVKHDCEMKRRKKIDVGYTLTS